MGIEREAVSAPARRTRAEAKADTRRRVVDSAQAVFRRRGYHAASLDQVAREAGFTKGAVYSTFDSKADLFLALLAERAAGRRAEIAEIFAAAPAAEDFVSEVARRFARSVSAERDWWVAVIEFMTAVGRDEALRARYAEHHDATRDALANSIAEWAKRAGRRRTIAPRRLATVVLALNNGLTLEGLLSPRDVPVRLYVDAHLGLFRGTQAVDGDEAGE